MNPENRKLTSDQVFDIRTRYRDGTDQRALASQFSVDQTCISAIVIGKTYKDVGWPPSLSSGQDRKSLPEFPGYEFDAAGNAYSYKKHKRYGKIMKLRINDSGYFLVSLVNKHGKQKQCRVNRMICSAFNGLPPTSEHQARHMNGVQTDNRAINLEWGTQSQNELDKIRHGTR